MFFNSKKIRHFLKTFLIPRAKPGTSASIHNTHIKILSLKLVVKISRTNVNDLLSASIFYFLSRKTYFLSSYLKKKHTPMRIHPTSVLRPTWIKNTSCPPSYLEKTFTQLSFIKLPAVICPTPEKTT